MSALKDITNKKFGRLTAIKFSQIKKRHYYWWFKCDCGKVVEKEKGGIIAGHIKSCGCLNSELSAQRKFTHGKSKTPVYKIWSYMIKRCNNHKYQYYYDYGGRGIKVCDRWLKFENFYEDMGERPEGKSLDRIDNDGDYCKENCRWATRLEQNNNKRNNIILTLNGESHTLSDWGRILGIKHSTLNSRYRRGYSIENILKKI